MLVYLANRMQVSNMQSFNCICYEETRSRERWKPYLELMEGGKIRWFLELGPIIKYRIGAFLFLSTLIGQNI